LGRKRARYSSRTFSWLSVLAPVEVQLVLRCLNFRSRVCRLLAARCSKQLYAAASHPFAWPQEQMVTLRMDNDASAMQALGTRVRCSLLRLSTIHLRVQQRPRGSGLLYHPEISSVQAITVHATLECGVVDDFLCPMLLHPAAQQLRSLDVSRFWYHRCSPLVLQHLQALPHLHSLSLGGPTGNNLPALHSLPLFPSLTHLSLQLHLAQAPQLYPLLSLCVRLVSLKLRLSTVSMDLLHCLAQLPLLQRLQLSRCVVEEQSATAWAALRSLHELEVDNVAEANRLFTVLGSVPALRLLRWHCRAPLSVAGPTATDALCLPQLEPLARLLLTARLLQVELLLPRTFDEWCSASHYIGYAELANCRRHVWVELHQFPSQLSRTRIVEVDPDDD
jgi:hypothetical protein